MASIIQFLQQMRDECGMEDGRSVFQDDREEQGSWQSPRNPEMSLEHSLQALRDDTWANLGKPWADLSRKLGKRGVEKGAEGA